jgi:hypothetical protein
MMSVARRVLLGSVMWGLTAPACAGSHDRSRERAEAGTAGAGTGGTGPEAGGGDGGASGGSGTPAEASTGGRGPVPEAGTDASVEASRDAGKDAGSGNHYEWQLFYDRSFAAHVEVDARGAAIVSGTFFDTKDIVLGATVLHSHGSADVFLSRVLPNGAVDWARGYGAAAEDYPLSFALDAQGRIALTGLYNGTGNIGGPDFPTFAGTPGRYDVFVAQLTASGDHVWSKTINTTADAFAGPGVSLDGSGDVLVAGSFKGTASFDPTTEAGPSVPWSAYTARHDQPDGTLGAAKTFGGTGDVRATAALFTGTDVIMVGTFAGQATFPTSPATVRASAGGLDVFVARGSTAGELTSVETFGGPGDEDVATARIDASKNLVIAGQFTSPTLSVFGAPALRNAGGRDAFVVKLTPALASIWAVSFGGDADDFVRDAAVGPGGVVAITGEFRDRIAIGADTWDAARAADAGAGPSDIDVFVAKLDANGRPLWSFATGGPAPDRGLNIAVDGEGALYATASFQSAIDFGGGDVLTPDPGEWASALVKYRP